MEFVQEGSNNYSDEDNDGEGRRETSNFFPNCSSDYSKYTHPWLHDAQDCSPSSSSSRSAMDLSLGGGNSSSRDHQDINQVQDEVVAAVEREHMFDKVVTPSDVGKLNRLVIPKQHAEKYFPLDSASNDKGLLLNFEDRNGKPWRFRYSYWNSSQSYVMTKGWSRFVKEKKLDAGDIVSFHRGRPDHAKDRLFIDWRRRPQTPHPHPSLRWASARLYSLPGPGPGSHYPPPPPPHHLNYHYAPNNYHNHPYHRQLGFSQPQQHLTIPPPEPVYYLRSSPSNQLYHQSMQHGSSGHVPMVIDSVPLLHGRSTAGKNKLRLFGVNMECEMSGDEDRVVLPSTALLPHVSAPPPPQFSDKGKSSLSFDLDL